ncbi:hypothetical protein FNV43_RR22346 [Rhamnella rubrinervis]|uniref:Uncharacterized protein n=1 Tax=Rhamnella rubrinervis TaxID=2594499 RepID=A0A8K0DWD9_9ROSA|nr:hypothetical protein FNV43_RR22346 [Rhamnella rubrinervis]
MNITTATTTGPQSALIFTLARLLAAALWLCLCASQSLSQRFFYPSAESKQVKTAFGFPDMYTGEREPSFLVKKENGDAKLGDKEDNGFKGEERKWEDNGGLGTSVGGTAAVCAVDTGITVSAPRKQPSGGFL